MDYKSPRWKSLRDRVLARDGYMCRECRRYGVAAAAVVVHHVRPAEDCPDRQWDADNLVSLCEPCHNAMHVRGSHELSALGRAWVRRLSPPPDAPSPGLCGTEEGGGLSPSGANGGGGYGPGAIE